MKFKVEETDLIPNHPRSGDFRLMVDAIEKYIVPPLNILETGTMRPKDFGSTLLFDQLVNYYDGDVWTVDKDADLARRVGQICTDRVTAVTDDSIRAIWALADTKKTFNIAWLDSLDVFWLDPHQSALHHLMEFAAVIRIMRRPCIIAVDDNREMQKLRSGKGKYLFDFMMSIDAEPVVLNYVYAWILR